MTNRTEREQILLLQQETKYMNEKIDKNHTEVMGAISDIKATLLKFPETFATKIEHKNNSDRIDKIEGIIGKIAWYIIMWVLGIAGASIFVVIMLFWDKF